MYSEQKSLFFGMYKGCFCVFLNKFFFCTLSLSHCPNLTITAVFLMQSCLNNEIDSWGGSKIDINSRIVYHVTKKGISYTSPNSEVAADVPEEKVWYITKHGFREIFHNKWT